MNKSTIDMTDAEYQQWLKEVVETQKAIQNFSLKNIFKPYGASNDNS